MAGRGGEKEYDFSNGDRGKFYRPGVELNIPVYLEPGVAKVVQELQKPTAQAQDPVANGETPVR